MNRRAWLCYGILALTALGCGPTELGQSAVHVQELKRARLASAADIGGVFLEFPAAMARWKDSLVIVDMLGSQIVVLPRSLEGGRAFGREGAGPGELRSPQGVAVHDESLAVFDRANARVTWYDASGELRGARGVMIASLKPKFVALEGMGLLLPAASADHYTLVDLPEGAAEAGGMAAGPLLPRPAGAAPSGEMPITSNMVVRSSGEVYVVDAENGLVIRGDPEALAVDSLPPRIHASVTRVVDSLTAGAPERVVTPIIAAGEAPGGVLVWFAGPGENWGAILDSAGSWTEVRVEPHLRAEFPPNPADVFIWDDELFVLTQDGVRVFGLGEPGDMERIEAVK
ncbi:MAG TPA: hypothetical protein VMN39_10305 [Longimicrobiaceae bacterium]|nr:hypothetical protein [Longimicrobiaceae bacterium]